MKKNGYFVVARDEEVYDKLKKRAKENGRSAASEALLIIKKAVEGRENEVRRSN